MAALNDTSSSEPLPLIALPHSLYSLSSHSASPTNDTDPSQQRRRLLSFIIPFTEEEYSRSNKRSINGDQGFALGGYVMRNGMRVRADEVELSDWIANMKRKQVLET